MQRRRTTYAARMVAVLAVLAGLHGPSVARAGDRSDDPGAGTNIEHRNHTLIVSAGAPGTLRLTTEPGQGGRGPTLYCGWFEVRIGGRPVFSLVDAVDPVEGDTYLLNCWIEQPTRPFAGYPIAARYSGRGSLPGPAVSTEEAARYAVDRIRFETPTAALSPPGRQVVGVPTWLAVTSNVDYRSVSAEAGPVWATVRPRFREAVWEMGNGDTVVCSADATKTGERPASEPSGCAYTYESGSDTRHRGRLTLRWTIDEMTDKTSGRWQVWGTVTISAPVTIEIDQLQAAIR